jgi:hypothetical protein
MVLGSLVGCLVAVALADEPRQPIFDAVSSLAATSPADPAQRWRRGEVQFAGRWTTPDDVARTVVTDPRLVAYRSQRAKSPDTVDGHLHLAEWCRDRGLADHTRAHLLVAAHLDPSDRRAFRLLGLRPYRGLWLSDDEIDTVRRREVEITQSRRAWRSRLLALRESLDSADVAMRTATVEEILGIRDPLAISELESILSLHSEPHALLVIRALTATPGEPASLSLARHAVWSEWETVRQAATESLNPRDKSEYVPLLIECLRPSESGVAVVHLGLGRFAEQWFWQDALTTRVVLLSSPPPIRGATTRLELRHAGRVQTAEGQWFHPAGTSSVQDLAHLVRPNYLKTEDGNSRRLHNTLAVLTQCTGRPFDENQERWRKWWAEVNDRIYNPSDYPEPRRYLDVYHCRIVANPSCFIAGTPVWTARGMIPIDHVQLGELVLSKNPDTGELSYKPTVRRTVRPRTPVVNVEVAGETIGATLGHPFWVTDRGWVTVKHLNADDSLGGLSDAYRITQLSDGPEDFAYNLELAAGNTYFVGRSRILVHDNTPVRQHAANPPAESPR